MDDFPVTVDEDVLSQFLISSTGSDLDALCTLDPPSPILTPSQLTFAWSSGDIPVLLYDDGYIDTLSELSDSDRTHSKRDSSATLRFKKFAAATALRNNWENSISNVPGTDYAPEILGSAESTTSVDSMGTFGPRSRKRTIRSSQVLRHSVASQSIKAPESSFPDFQNTAIVDFDDKFMVQCQDSRTSRGSGHALSGAFYHPVVFVDAKPSQKADLKLDTTFSELAESPSPDGPFAEQILSESQSPRNSDDEEGDRTLIPTKASPKSLSWISSQSWDHGQYKDFIADKNLARFPPPTQIVEFNDVECNALHVSPPRRKVLERHHHVRKLENSSPSQAPHQNNQRHHREQSVKLVNQAPSRPERAIALSLDNDWLQDIYVQFLIDQEGFRAANPFFSFIGIVRLRSSQNLRTGGGGVMAQFKPITRQAFHFHHAPFETPPILRRITVNGDDTHDYVSKQALLPCKINGVYVLRGHEISVSNNHNSLDFESIKLHWQFEYLVDDRVADTSGRIMEGEKILTPLTFSCSPGLLLTQQARKNNIMHVFKKGVAPKLVAEKLQPPGMSSPAKKGFSLVPLPPSPPSSQPEAPVSGFFSSKSHGWGLHRRGQSHGVRHDERQNGSPARSPIPQYNTTPNRNKIVLDIKPLDLDSPSNTHRRRNSSAGEHNDSPVRLHFNTTKNPTAKQRRFTHTQKPISLSRHIVSPAKLTKLLDTATKENLNLATPHVPVPVVPDRNSSNFMPLAPRPRHAHVKSRDLGRA